MEGLREVVRGAVPDREHRLVDRGVARDRDHDGRRGHGARGLEDGEAAGTRHAHVRDDEVVGGARRSCLIAAWPSLTVSTR